MTQSNVRDWYASQFLPWQQQAQAYVAEKLQRQQQLRRQLPALQTLVGLLLEGRTKQAVLAWNSLGLEPVLNELIVSRDGNQVMLRAKGGRTETLNLDDIIAGLQALATEVPATPSPDRASAP